MQFIIIANDHPTHIAAPKRAANRSEHLQLLNALKACGRIHEAGAILSENGEMIGSVIIANFPDREALDIYLGSEPFRREGVWRDTEILPFRTVQWERLPVQEEFS